MSASLQESSYLKKLGKTLKMRRIYLDLRQNEVAKTIEFSPNYISMVEAGIRKPSLKFLRKYSSALGWTLSILFRAVEDLLLKRADSYSVEVNNV